jgi:glycosyltransferase involved in cell wall biosynthesis
MKLLNINSYYLSSSLYKPMEDSLIKEGFSLATYVPVYEGYQGRKEIDFQIPDYVKISKCFNKRDRILFHLKHSKIKKDIFRWFKLNEFNIIHAHSLFSNGYIAYHLYKKYGIPYIVNVRSTDIYVFFKRMVHLRRIGLLILMNATKVVFLSESHKHECLNKFIPNKIKNQIKNKCVVIPNGIDDFWFKNKIDRVNRDSKELIKIIFVGDDSKRKNLVSLIKACDILINQEVNLELCVVGDVSDGTQRNYRKKDYIKFMGRMTKEQLLLEYRNNDIFVLPSIIETFGLVYPEAMSQGLPVIYTSGQGFDRQFQEGVVGYSVDCLSPKDIAKKILKVNKEYDVISSRCLTLVDRFRWGNIIKEYINLYNNI